MFHERCKLVADVVCCLDSCFDFSVKSSFFCKYVTEVLELGHLLELSVVDVEFAECSVHLHCLGLADADLLSYSSQVVFRLLGCFCNFFSGSFARLWSSTNIISFKASGSGFVILSMYIMTSSGYRTHPCFTPDVIWLLLA